MPAGNPQAYVRQGMSPAVAKTLAAQKSSPVNPNRKAVVTKRTGPPAHANASAVGRWASGGKVGARPTVKANIQAAAARRVIQKRTTGSFAPRPAPRSAS